MNKKYLLITMALAFSFALLTIISIKGLPQDNKGLPQDKPLTNTMIGSLKCSQELEGLKLCTNSHQITVKSGEPIILNLSWVNSSKFVHKITRSNSYKVTIVDEKKKALSPVSQGKFQKGALTQEDKKRFIKSARGSERTLSLNADITEEIELDLTGRYDYDLTAKGKYYVTIEKIVPNVENKTEVTFLLNNIEIEVK